MSPRNDNGATMRGTLTQYGEQGFGPLWSLARDGGAPGMRPDHIEHGDFLRVFKDAACETVEWEGAVSYDKTIDNVTFRAVAEHGVEIRATYWSEDGFPADMPHRWASWFINGRKAELVKAKPQ